jgi:glutamyl-tRNA reductase
MHPELQIVLVGLSHRTAPVAVRERFVVAQNDVRACVHGLLHGSDIREAAVLSTCNRTEVFVSGLRGTDLVTPVLQHVFRNLAPEHVYTYADVHAAIHLFRVASGLDSLVMGESEVLRQLKRAYDAAAEVKALGELLGPLLQQAIRVGKRVRAETAVGQGSLSVARTAVDVAGRVVGRFEGRCALVLGAGETGLAVGRSLVERGVRDLVVANRTPERAAAIAQELGAQAAGLEQLEELVASADMLFACVEGEGGLVTPATFNRRRLGRRDRPLFIADLSVPRAVDPAVRELRQLLLYDLDDIGRVVDEHRRARDGAARDSDAILVAELHKFLSLRTYASFTPAIEKLRERFETTRDAVLDEVAGSAASPEAVQLSHLLARRLLDVALAQMKDSARQTRSEEVLDREHRRLLENL